MIVNEAQIDDAKKSSCSQIVIIHHTICMLFNADFQMSYASIRKAFIDDFTSTKVADHVPGQLKP